MSVTGIAYGKDSRQSTARFFYRNSRQVFEPVAFMEGKAVRKFFRIVYGYFRYILAADC